MIQTTLAFQSNDIPIDLISNPFLQEVMDEIGPQQSATNTSNMLQQHAQQNGLTQPVNSDPNGTETKKSRFPTFQTLFKSTFRQHPPHHGNTQQNKETINPLLKPHHCDRIFSDLPGELIHIILCYYTHSFKDLIKFSTINKTCKEISDYSLLWLQINLMFYPPKEYLHQKGYYHYSTYISFEEFIETQIRSNFLPKLEKVLFSPETIFPPVCKVYVAPFQEELTRFKKSSEELDYELAYRVGEWWRPLFAQYQRLYHWHMIYFPYLNYIYAKTNNLNRNFHYFLIGTGCVGIVSIYLLFDCNNPNLSLENKIGFYLILGIVGFYIILSLLYMINSIAENQMYNYDTLYFRWRSSTLTGFSVLFLACVSGFIGLYLILLKCLGSFGNSVDWWETVLPLWIASSLVYGLWYYENRENYDRWDIFFKAVASYIAISPPLTCTLVACYYDNIYTGPFQYTLFPLYPIFLSALLGFGFRVVYTGFIIYDIIRGRSILSVFSNYEWLNSLAYFSIFSMTNITIVINSWSVMMLLIDSYRIDDNDWDKGFFTVHFSPLTCFLIFIFSCPCILVGLFLEDMYNY